MAIQLLDKIDQQHDEWIELRKKSIGSSEIATVAGLNPYQSPLELWAIKTGKVESTLDQNAGFLRFGRLLEPFIVEEFEKTTGLRTVQSKTFWCHESEDWATASPDAFAFEPVFIDPQTPDYIVECKTANYKQIAKWTEDSAPESYQMQLQWQLGILGVPGGYLAGLVGGDVNLITYRYEADPDLFDMLMQLGGEFMKRVKRDIPPAAGPGDARAIERIVNRVKGKQLKIVGSAAVEADQALYTISRLKESKRGFDEQVDALEAEIKRKENQLKLMLGDASIGVLPDGREIKVSRVNCSERIQPAYNYTRIYLPK